MTTHASSHRSVTFKPVRKRTHTPTPFSNNAFILICSYLPLRLTIAKMCSLNKAHRARLNSSFRLLRQTRP